MRGPEADAPTRVPLDSCSAATGDIDFVRDAGFDGAYTYFAADGFTEGSRSDWWSDARERMEANGKLFYPSVGPGYNDTLIRPWNAQQTRGRGRGAYYDRMWRNALHASPNGITITSYNEWGEGTQIEGARPHTSRNGSRAYADYTPDGPQFYMKRTKEWVEQAKRGCEAASLRQERVEL